MHLPLKNLKVLDLSRVLAGPFCGMTLGDLGANVIKVERPVGGDDTRSWGPPFDDHGQSAYFLSINRNKLSIALDFRLATDMVLLHALIAQADVVIENYLPSALARFGVNASAKLVEHSRLIWCTISGFGPLSTRPGYDFVLQAESGWMSITGPEAGPPMRTGVALIDVLAGKDAVTAILAALLHRDTPDANRAIHISLADSAAAALVNVAQNTLVSELDARRWGNAHPNLVPYQLFAASDRPFVIAVGTDRQWRAAAKALDLHGLADDHTLFTNAGRIAHRKRLIAAMSERLASQTALHWIERLDMAGVPCGMVRSVREALNGTMASSKTGVPSSVGGQIRYAPPVLDEHGLLIRTKNWSAFDHVPILDSQDV